MYVNEACRDSLKKLIDIKPQSVEGQAVAEAPPALTEATGRTVSDAGIEPLSINRSLLLNRHSKSTPNLSSLNPENVTRARSISSTSSSLSTSPSLPGHGDSTETTNTPSQQNPEDIPSTNTTSQQNPEGTSSLSGNQENPSVTERTGRTEPGSSNGLNEQDASKATHEPPISYDKDKYAQDDDQQTLSPSESTLDLSSLNPEGTSSRGDPIEIPTTISQKKPENIPSTILKPFNKKNIVGLVLGIMLLSGGFTAIELALAKFGNTPKGMKFISLITAGSLLITCGIALLCINSYSIHKKRAEHVIKDTQDIGVS